MHPLAEDGDADALWLRNPDGTPLQLVVAPKVSPNAKALPTPRPTVPHGLGAAPSRSANRKVLPRFLSHVLFFSPDVARMLTFVEEVLGLRLSDHAGDLIAFVHTPHGFIVNNELQDKDPP